MPPKRSSAKKGCCVVNSVSIATSIHPVMRANQLGIKTNRTPNWLEMPIFKGVFRSYTMPNLVVDVIGGKAMTKRYTKAKIQIAENPFDHGSEQKLFYGRDMSNKTPVDIVLKEYIPKNTDTASQSSAFPYEIATQMQTIAVYLASEFNVHLEKKAGIRHDIKFLKVQVLAIEVGPGPKRYMSCERRCGRDSEFIRFSGYEMLECTCTANNMKFDVVELLMAFSHWTYKITGGYLMVVDLQGVLNMSESGRKTLELTDPAIHCTHLTRFGRTNLGEEGMKIFFSRHKCNRFCQAMGLEKHEATIS
ncbi:alpha-kinase family domain-containing protein [Ditylenchus destructor]|uniref:Alpha-kinase family domain-containing protein n=1 Tax=Ditylenchus destructor TaxID=166010 RepID=A0AAD4QVA1_9BILA|nr:alpha-kinase family domain-containing protein [Ditylenchus destructor]